MCLASDAYGSPPCTTVYYCCRQWRIDGTRKRINTALREQLCTSTRREAETVETTEEGSCAATVPGKIKGRERHILVDTLGLLLEVLVFEPVLQDRTVAPWSSRAIKSLFSWVQLI
jgi:transposase